MVSRSIVGVVRSADMLLVILAGSFVLLGPWMAFQELAHVDLEAETADTARPVDVGHRSLWSGVLPVVVLAAGALGTWTLLRVNAQARVRSVARRPAVVLMLGMVVLELAYFLDWSHALAGPHLPRAVLTLALYPLGGFLIAGAAYSLGELEEAFTRRNPDNAAAGPG